MTRNCPLKCRHCAVKAGPKYHETIPIDKVEQWLKGVKEAGNAELIAVSGGEPFAKAKVLAEILRCAHDFGFKAVAITSGFWATNIGNARKVLSSLPSFTALEISADKFHEECIPIERIRYAAFAALERGMTVIIGTADYPGDFYKDRLYETLGDDLLRKIEFLENNVHAVGRALENRLVPTEYSHDLPEGACDGLCAPVIRYDGNILACCHNEIIYQDNHSLWLGNLNRESFHEIYERANGNYLIQALRTIGPKGIVDIAAEEGWEWKPRLYRKGNICDLCKDIISSPNLISRFEEYARDKAFRYEIAIARFFRYGEAMQV